MSYPDLGCFAECLECELCEQGLDGGEDPDLFPDDLPDTDPFGLDDWNPPEEPQGPDEWWNDWNVPTGGPSVGGGMEINPTYENGAFGIEISGKW